MHKPIVVGFNGSAGSAAALTWALRRAARHKLPVIVIHAVDDRWMSPDFQYHELIRESGMELLGRAKASASEQAPGVEVEVQLRHGSAGRALREASKEASMVVVGAHDKHWLDGGPLTDRALQIVAASDSPAAVVPEKQGTRGSGVVVGVDGSEESLQAVAFAAAEADLGGDELTVVLAFRSPARWVEHQLPASGLAESIVEEDRIVLAESVAGLGDKYPDLVVHQRLETDTDPAKALVDIASEARLLVIGSRGRGGLSRTVLGSTAHAVLLNVPCPTIVARVHKVKHDQD
ncbi:universal stress protein [Arthrobacter sp. RHLT1-20]